MQTDIGEYLVGAYLKIIKECDFVDYNVRPPCRGLEGLGELDVIGLDLKNKIAYLCEVTTHLTGALYKDNPTTILRIKKKYERQKKYADKYLSMFPSRHYMFWSPIVCKGYLTNELKKIDGLELRINEGYSKAIQELKKRSKITTKYDGNPAFRMLQIMESLRT